MRTSTRNLVPVLAVCLSFCSYALRADQLQMQNGDHYTGKIVSVTSNVVVLQSDVLGRIALPREKVLTLTFGSVVPTNTIPIIATAPAMTTTSPRIATTNADDTDLL